MHAVVPMNRWVNYVLVCTVHLSYHIQTQSKQQTALLQRKSTHPSLTRILHSLRISMYEMCCPAEYAFPL